MENETNNIKFYEDVCNLARVLPNLEPATVYNELYTLKDNSDRVQVILKKYFRTYEPQEHNCLSDDIKNIKRVVPNFPITDINHELWQVEQKENRVQLVLKNYFNNNTTTKRSLPLDPTDVDNFYTEKKVKVEDNIRTQENEQNTDEGSTEIYSLSLDDMNTYVFPTDQLEIKNNDTENCTEENVFKTIDNEEQLLPKITILSTLTELFPQYSIDVFDTVCKELNINLNDPLHESQIDLAVNALIIYKPREKTPVKEPKIVPANIVSSSFEQNSSTTESESNELEITDIYQSFEYPQKRFQNHKNKHIKKCSFSNNSKNIVLEGPLPGEEISMVNKEKFNIGNILNVHKLPLNLKSNICLKAEKNVTTVPITNSISDNISMDHLYYKLHIDDKPEQSLNDSNSTITSTYRSDFHGEVIIDPNSILHQNLNLENKSFPVHLNSFPGSSNANTTLMEGASNFILNYDSQSFFVPNSSSNTDFMKSEKTDINPTRIVLSENEPSSSNLLRNSYVGIPFKGMNMNTPDYHIRPSTSKVVNNFMDEPMPSTSAYPAMVNDQSINNSIRVRTDLYDAYFNGPNIPTTEISSSEIEDIDDIVFVSCEKSDENNSESTISSSPAIINKAKSGAVVTIDSIEPSTSQVNENHQIYFKLMEMFPDICPYYLKEFCAKHSSSQNVDDLITILLEGNYNKRNRPASPAVNLDFEEQHNLLKDLFPDADPTYLQHHCERLIDQPENFKMFVAALLEHKNYPTKAEHLKKLKLSAQEKQYTTEFDVKKFLEIIPNPEEYFNDPKRQVSYENFDDTNYAIIFLKNTFCTTAIKDITTIFRKTHFSVLKSANILQKLQNMKSKRKPYPVTSCKNIPLLQEIAYVKHKNEILDYIKKQELEKNKAREYAKSAGLMKTCQCCFDDEVMPIDTATCESKLHIFCKDCIRKGSEVLIGEGKLHFPCLETCDSFFTMQVLQSVLAPKVFSKVAQRRQMEEVKSAGIEDLEFCPFCDFATIPAPDDKIFHCLNDDCMKDSCRLCHEPSHIPLRCDEVEKDQDIKMRTYIENKMTEALLRKCYKCGLKFIKESGCNKMKCSCGAMMCYVCNQPVKDYTHFNGPGGDQYQLCSLYNDTHKLHVEAVKRGAALAKKELGVNTTNSLKIDPTTDIEQHYRRLAELNPITNILPP